MKNFEVGHRYYMRSICDHNCIWEYEITARTDKTITIQPIGKTEQKKLRIIGKLSEDCKAESVYPLGKYSMCPILSADHELK